MEHNKGMAQYSVTAAADKKLTDAPAAGAAYSETDGTTQILIQNQDPTNALRVRWDGGSCAAQPYLLVFGTETFELETDPSKVTMRGDTATVVVVVAYQGI